MMAWTPCAASGIDIQKGAQSPSRLVQPHSSGDGSSGVDSNDCPTRNQLDKLHAYSVLEELLSLVEWYSFVDLS